MSLTRPAADLMLPARSIGDSLFALASEEYQKASRTVELVAGKSIYPVGAIVHEVHFPIDAVISTVVTMDDGRSAEALLSGRYEISGASAVMDGREPAQLATNVQVSGTAASVRAQIVQDEFDRNAPYRKLFLKGMQAMIAQISQTAACNRLHPVEARYARWLLEVRDRIDRDEFDLTQEFVSQMLGVRRVTVTEVAGIFAEEKIIQPRRGAVRLLDIEKLQSRACECYAILKSEIERLYGALSASLAPKS
jgi:hypothetical protein